MLTLLLLSLLCTCVRAQKTMWKADVILTDGRALEGVAARGEQIVPTDSTSIVTPAAVYYAILALGGGGGGPAFDPTKPILRVPQIGDTVPNFAWYYFVEPSLSLSLVPTNTLYEIGTVNSISVNTVTSNDAAAMLSNGVTTEDGSQVGTFGANASSTTSVTFSPTASGDQAKNYQASQGYSGSGESGTATSNTRSVKGVYPVLSGVSPTDFTAGGDPYTSLSVTIADEGTISRALNGSGFIYYAFPETWSANNLARIEDPNGFNVTPSFTVQTISVSSSGLTNNWTQNYRIYKLNSTTTVNNGTYNFVR